MWELEVEGFEHLILASDLVEVIGQGHQVVAQSILKSNIANLAAENKVYARCAQCRCPLQYVAASATTSAYFRHDMLKAEDEYGAQICMFHSNTTSFFSTGSVYHGEGKWHIYHKLWLAEQLRNSCDVVASSVKVERYIFSKDPEVNARRRPDIYFEDINDNRFVIELTRWWMSPEVVAQREAFFRREGINLIWLFSPTCYENNNTTLNLVLFGSPATRKIELDHVFTEVECNAFILTDEAKLKTEQYRQLWFEVLYPKGTYDSQGQTIEFTLCRSLRAASQLNLSPKVRLPFAIQTSLSFIESLAQQEARQRLELAKQVWAIRLAAKGEYFIRTAEAAVYYREHLNGLSRIPVDYRFNLRLKQLLAQAEARYDTAYQDLLLSQSRKKAAYILNIRRNRVNEVLYQVKEPRPYLSLDNLQMELSELKAYNNKDNYSSLLNQRISRGERRLQVLVEIQKKNEDQRRQAELKRHQAGFAVMDTFLKELEQGFSQIPSDTAALKVKANRIKLWASENGYAKQAEMIDNALVMAIQSALKVFCEQHFPMVSNPWKPHHLYKSELDRAFTFIGCNPYSLSQKSQYKQHQENASAIRGMLNVFKESLQIQLKSYHDEISIVEPALLSMFFNKKRTVVVKLIACIQYMIKHGIKFSSDDLERINLIKVVLKHFEEGKDSNIIYRRIHSRR
ncbi:hypothetical protein EA58_01275 [Photobacterium galatheae]|uniref:Competence protein CoiA nuclease-like domain-containing protein n=2 Tax=Photobacterium galatheae TaxID=1654360 RepID=A0A066S019_9GAMM|nr:hypothetical protein EA58_01275 [Photobacterium galatheae]